MTPIKTEPGSSPLPTSITVISHSMLFYWWPVWLCGLLFGVLSLLDGYHLAVVPEGASLTGPTDIAGSPVYTLIVPRDDPILRGAAGENEPFPVRVTASPVYGLIFCTVLLFVIFSTNVPLRGLWSWVALLSLIILALVFAGLGLWGTIAQTLGRLHIYLSAAGYLFVSIALLLLWLVTVFGYDRQRYIVFTPGQLVVHREVGDMQRVYDTANVTVEKRRSDLFRHVLLGFLSGDLIIQLPGQQGGQLELPNVLFAEWKVKQVADLMKTRPIVTE
jgi:hypothetical protein